MQWDKDKLKDARVKAKLSQPALANKLGIHWRTLQNWEKTGQIPISIFPALDLIFRVDSEYVSREEYNKVLAALDSATELNRQLTGLLQNGAVNK